MKSYYIMYNMNYTPTLKFFKNTVLLPICTNCAHFIHSPMSYKHGQCRKFGKIYLTTGVIEYDFANDCRDDSKKCGMFGSQYREK